MLRKLRALNRHLAISKHHVERKLRTLNWHLAISKHHVERTLRALNWHLATSKHYVERKLRALNWHLATSKHYVERKLRALNWHLATSKHYVERKLRALNWHLATSKHYVERKLRALNWHLATSKHYVERKLRALNWHLATSKHYVERTPLLSKLSLVYNIHLSCCIETLWFLSNQRHSHYLIMHSCKIDLKDHCVLLVFHTNMIYFAIIRLFEINTQKCSFNWKNRIWKCRLQIVSHICSGFYVIICAPCIKAKWRIYAPVY